MRNEATYIIEWVAYYRALGFDQIIIYDHLSTDDTTALCAALARAGLIRHVPWTDQPDNHNAQVPAYSQAAATCGTDWLCCLDADEFLCLEQAESIHDLLATAGVHGMPIALSWRNFGSGGAEQREAGLVIERFTRHCGPENQVTTHIKTLAPVSAVAQGAVVHVHGWPLGPGQYYVNACGDRTEIAMHTFLAPPWWRCAWVNHYPVKSREEYTAKMHRGRVDRREGDPEKHSQGESNYFRPLDTNDLEDLTIQRSRPRVSAEIALLTAALERDDIWRHHQSPQPKLGLDG